MREEEILDAIGPLINEGFEFQGKDYLAFVGPCVYLMTGEEGVLYVGMSKNGLSRPFSRHHRAMRLRSSQIQKILVYSVDSEEVARTVEALLIHVFSPPWNSIAPETRPSLRKLMARLASMLTHKM